SMSRWTMPAPCRSSPTPSAWRTCNEESFSLRARSCPAVAAAGACGRGSGYLLRPVVSARIRSPMIRILLLCLAALCAAPALAKVEFEAAQQKNIGRVLIVKVSEEIAPGDYDALLKGMRAHPGKFARKILLLDSIGGSAAEAMRMGRLLRETG